MAHAAHSGRRSELSEAQKQRLIAEYGTEENVMLDEQGNLINGEVRREGGAVPRGRGQGDRPLPCVRRWAGTGMAKTALKTATAGWRRT